MKTYRCSRCKGKFDRDGVQKYSKSVYGVQYYYCVKCNTDRVRRYRSTDKGRQNINRAVAKSVRKHSGKQKARMILNCLVRKGLIIKPEGCFKCMKPLKLEAHHCDYSKPLDVVWMCRSCHSLEDRKVLK